MLKDIAGKVKHYLTMENTLFTHGWGKSEKMQKKPTLLCS